MITKNEQRIIDRVNGTKRSKTDSPALKRLRALYGSQTKSASKPAARTNLPGLLEQAGQFGVADRHCITEFLLSGQARSTASDSVKAWAKRFSKLSQDQQAATVAKLGKIHTEWQLSSRYKTVADEKAWQKRLNSLDGVA